MEKKLLPVPSLVLFTCLNLIPSSRVPRSVQPHKRQVRQYKCHETEVIVTPGGSERILGWGDKLRALVPNARLFTQHKQLRDPRTNDATKTWSLIRPWSPPRLLRLPLPNTPPNRGPRAPLVVSWFCRDSVNFHFTTRLFLPEVKCRSFSIAKTASCSARVCVLGT